MQTTFHVPEDLAVELTGAGLAQSPEPVPSHLPAASYISSGEVATVALIVLGATSDVVSLVGLNPPLRALADRILAWAKNRTHKPPYQLLAIGPKGQARIDLTEAPDPEAVVEVIKMVYGDEPD